jgi:hypothetical protein
MMAPPEMSVSLHLKHLPIGSYEVTVTGSDGWFHLSFLVIYNIFNTQAQVRRSFMRRSKFHLKSP